MKLTFLGSGAAFGLDGNYHSNMLLQSESGKNLLIDCGTDIRFSTHALGFSYLDITDVYISHLHADHAGGLEWLAFKTKFDPKYKGKPNLYISDELVEDLWEHSLKAGLSSVQGEEPSLSTFFNVHPVVKNSFFKWEGIAFRLVQTVHIVSGFCIMPSFGLHFNVNGKNVYITTDTQFSPSQIRDYYLLSDIVFQDCETTTCRSGVHANYVDLKTLHKDEKKKMWLYHYDSENLPDAKADGFLGFVKKGQTFEF